MPAGRPPLYDTPEKMQEIIDRYFAERFASDPPKPPTISGLAYALEMTTESLRNYENRDQFFATVKRAKQRVAIALEQRLYGQAVTGAIFNLKNNFGWKDKSEQEITGANGGPLGILLKEISGNTLGPNQ